MKCRSARAICATRSSSPARLGAQSMIQVRASSLLPILARASAASSRISSAVDPHGYSGDHRIVATARFHTIDATRLGLLAAKTAKAAPVVRSPNKTARGDRMASSTAKRSCARVSRLGNDPRPESPVPRRSWRMSRENRESRSNRSASASTSHRVSMPPQSESSRTRSTGRFGRWSGTRGHPVMRGCVARFRRADHPPTLSDGSRRRCSFEAVRRPSPEYAMLLGAVLLWALNVTVTKYMFEHGWQPLAYGTIRYFAAISLFWIFTYRREGSFRIAREDWHLVAIAAAMIFMQPDRVRLQPRVRAGVDGVAALRDDAGVRRDRLAHLPAGEADARVLGRRRAHVRRGCARRRRCGRRLQLGDEGQPHRDLHRADVGVLHGRDRAAHAEVLAVPDQRGRARARLAAARARLDPADLTPAVPLRRR